MFSRTTLSATEEQLGDVCNCNLAWLLKAELLAFDYQGENHAQYFLGTRLLYISLFTESDSLKACYLGKYNLAVEQRMF